MSQPGRQHLKAPTAKLPPGSVWDLDVKTNCGTFTIEVDSAISPNTASSVVSLAKSGFYDGLAIHRLVPGFVIQGGDPAANGSGGPGFKTVDRPAAGTTYRRGTVAMAKTSAEPPGTAGSQFFVVTGDDAGLPPEYAVIGRVTKGITVADLISSQPIDQAKAMGGSNDGPPKQPIVIESVKVSQIR